MLTTTLPLCSGCMSAKSRHRDTTEAGPVLDPHRLHKAATRLAVPGPPRWWPCARGHAAIAQRFTMTNEFAPRDGCGTRALVTTIAHAGAKPSTRHSPTQANSRCPKGRRPANMNWFERLTGFNESTYDNTKEQLEIDGTTLRSKANGKTYNIGMFEMASLGGPARPVSRRHWRRGQAAPEYRDRRRARDAPGAGAQGRPLPGCKPVQRAGDGRGPT